MRKYYRNCNEIPVYNFYTTVEKKDLRYLIVGYDDMDDGVVLSKQEKLKLVGLWESIYEEYLELTNDRSSFIYYELKGDLERLNTVYDIVSQILDIAENNTIPYDLKEFLVIELRKFKYKIDLKKDFNTEVERIKRELKASTNTINIKKIELEELEKKDNKKSLTLIQQQVKLEQGLGRNNIDIKTTVLTKWMAMIDEVKEIVKASKEKNGK